ncbi:aldehyde dehydrogenase family protein [Sinimarinibacterium sp. CAU 1509]|uniref:aldehyde dehydrogenase family protein n=1 Tax=Sinimarinibacterium sp. CAU 1509 TaxID=2562283 RepID=UPI0010AC9B78|nr:aldehyde dehydrogenase family protein [Sinimarinibacterium sp. CAU 1509]TJY61006.1 aldehyde dehydrogenase family protein [Sinimarinibacterium sp. CAU 1509]
MRTFDRHYIDGQWQASTAAASAVAVINPATEQPIASVHMGGAADLERAIDAAYRAFPAYAATPLSERLALLQRIAAVYERRVEEMALAITTEMGAPYEQLSRTLQAPIGLWHFQIAAALAEHFEWERTQGSTVLLREPVGVCSLITPWNWPMNQIACKLAPALLAGCTVVLKPSDLAPLSAHLLAEILDEAGAPAGVFNLVWGMGPEIGPSMATHPKVDMVSLTGSTAAGAAVARNGADSIKRVSLELGGKSANIILEDAPLKQAVTQGVLQMMINSGQSCNAPSRMLVPAAMLAEVEQIAAEAVQQLVVGDPLDARTTTGPIANARQFQRVQALIAAGIDEGATLVAGGLGRPDGLTQGYYARPTVFVAADNQARIAREEIFGPVLTIIPYRSEDEAVAMANDSEYGLSGYVWGGSIERASAVARRLRTGMVHLNGAGLDLHAPFGGYKRSGLGREWGAAGIEEFTQLKAVMGAVSL